MSYRDTVFFLFYQVRDSIYIFIALLIYTSYSLLITILIISLYKLKDYVTALDHEIKKLKGFKGRTSNRVVWTFFDKGKSAVLQKSEEKCMNKWCH